MAKALPEIPGVEAICALPRKEIKADLRMVQERLRIATEKRERLARKLQAAIDEETRLALQAQMLSLGLRLRTGAAASPRVAPAPRPRAQTLTADVVAIVRQAQGAPVTPQQVHARLAELGIDRSERVIRQALRRWRDQGALVRDGHAYRALAA